MSLRRLELHVERLSKSGDGVAHVEGRAVFVSGALPGERVLAEVTELGKALRGEVLEVLAPSPARRAPACALADVCGGCDWMHVDEQVQLAEKEQIVVSALEHLADLEPGSYVLLPRVASPRALGYRRRAVLHPADGRLGFFGRRSHTRVAVESCPALTGPLEPLPGLLAAALGAGLKDVEEVHLLEVGGQVAVSVHLKGAAKARFGEVLGGLIREGRLAGAVVAPGEGKGGVEVHGQAVLEEDGVLYRPDGFAQANAAVNRELVARAVDALEPLAGQTVLELYSGNGNFTFPIAARGAQVVAVESAPVSVQLAQQAARAKGLAGVRFVQGDAQKVADGLVREGQRFDRLLLDPPRTGAPGIGALASKLLVSRLVYVACDPAALARDAGELWSHGFRPVSLQVFDLFPQTRHVEAVLCLGR